MLPEHARAAADEPPAGWSQVERSLDPEDWPAFRRLAHRMVDDMLDSLEHVRERPVWRPVPPDVKRRFASVLPLDGIGAEAAYEEFRRDVLPYPTGNTHPRFWGWVLGTGTPLGMMADMLAAGMNPNCWGNETSAAYVEGQVIDWFKALFGFPAGASGLLVTGCSVANMIGLAVARNARAGMDLSAYGLAGLGRPPVVYCSRETHNSIDKAALLLGLGGGAVRKLPVGGDYRLDVGALARAVAADREAGLHPFAVVANAGTVNTGAIDDLDAIRDVATAHDLWMHVDGAFGALAALAPGDHRTALLGMARADSLAFDLHKWLYVPFDAACVLVRDEDAHRRSFSPAASYLAHETRGTGSGVHWFNELGMELSRGFRALKVWMSLREHGVRRYGDQIAQNLAQARYLAELVRAAPDLELSAPVTLNVVCFRVRPGEEDGTGADALNREVLLRLQERGVAVPSATRLHGRYVIRVAITSHRSRREDFELLVESVREIAREVRGSPAP